MSKLPILEPRLPLAEAQLVAEFLVGEVDWQGAHGFCRCPGQSLHTTGQTPRDLHVVVEPLASGVVPGVYCFHDRCRAVSEAVSYQLRSALGKRSPSPRPLLSRAAPAPKAKPAFDPATLARIAAKLEGTDDEWFAARSAKCVWNRTPASFLHSLYEPGEEVVVFDVFASQGQALWRCQAPPFDARELDGFRTGKPCGVWFLANPVTGEKLSNDRGTLSRRSWQNVTSWRYVVLESDKADPAHWLAALAQLPLPIAAIYTSGVRSIHVLVRLDAESKEQWDDAVAEMEPALVTLGADPSALTAVRLTRLPCCERLGTTDKAGMYRRYDAPQMQRLLYLNPNPDATPIVEKEAL